MDDRYIIDTPENIEFGYDIAGIGSRFLAAILDSLLILLLQILVVFVIGGALLSDLLEKTLGISTSLLNALGILLSFVILWGYYICFEMIWNGQSPGKRVIGLRVVREGGRPITFVSAAIRNLIRIIDFLPMLYGIGVVVMFIDRRARRLGDLTAGTLVVKERRMVTLESLTAPNPMSPLLHPGPSARQVTLPNIHMLTDQDYTIVQEFLQRRAQLGRDARLRLGVQLAESLQTRLGLPKDGDVENFLQYVVAEYQLFKRQQAG